MRAIEFYNRYSGEIESEEIYGEKWLRWAYESRVGRVSVEVLAKRALFSKLFGWRMSLPSSRARVLPFIDDYGIDASEFADEPDSYQSFNEFFYRKLKDMARPVDADPGSVVFPADGRHLGFADLSRCDGVFVKGQRFDLPSLLENSALAERYAHGSAVLSRLCPVDYHRYHFCADGTPSAARVAQGSLYSVSPVALRRNLQLLTENKRVITELRTECLGTVLVMEIGATNVGTIRQSFRAEAPVVKGAEKGWFEFGGSAVMTFFEPGRVELAADLLQHSSEQREVYAKMGDTLGRVLPNDAGTFVRPPLPTASL